MSYRVLVVVDMQNDFVTGALGTPEAQAIVSNVKELIENGGFDQIVFTMDTHRSNYLETQEGRLLPVKHCIAMTHGWEIIPGLQTYPRTFDSCSRVPKSTFGKYDLYSHFVKMPTEIVLVGVCTDICVISNALILKSCASEAKITIIENATAGTTPEAKAAALQIAKSCQIFVE